MSILEWPPLALLLLISEHTVPAEPFAGNHLSLSPQARLKFYTINKFERAVQMVFIAEVGLLTQNPLWPFSGMA